MRKNMGVYRGKTKDGEWVEGYFAKTILSNGELIYEIRDIEEEHRLACYTEVLPETVGQWTGMKDENGKRIFEGDIIGSMDGHDGYLSREGYIVGAVNWDDETLSWQVTNRIEAESYEILASDNETLEVIGNIHDNPELLKE